MARASSYTKLTELTAEQQAKFKETATILAQGKTTTDGATTDINIPFDEFGGSGGGGGGAPYTRATATFDNPSWVEPNYFKQSITIQNNTYTVGSGIIPEPEGYGHDGYRTKRLDVRITADFPMAILKLENLNLELNEIHVFNGNTELPQLYPIAIKLEEQDYDYGNTYASYAHSNFGLASIVEIHILGDTYTILSSVGATDGLS